MPSSTGSAPSSSTRIDVAGRNHDLVLLSRVAATGARGPTRCCTTSAGCSRRTTRASRSCPTAELPWYRVTWDRARERTRGGVRRPRRPRRGAARRILARGPLSRPTSSRAPRSTGTGARRTRSGRCWRRWPRPGILGLARRDGNRRVYDLAERLFPAELLAEPRRLTSSSATSCCRATGPTGCSGTGGQAELWFGTARLRKRTATRCGESSSSMTGVLRAGDRRGRPGPAVHRSPRTCRSLDAAEAGSRETCPARRPASLSSPARPARLGSRPPSALFDFDYVWEVYVPAKRAGATTCCRSCSATALSGGSSRASIGAPGPPRPRAVVARQASTRSPAGFVDAFMTRSRRMPSSPASPGSCWHGPRGTAPWSGRCRSCSDEVDASAADLRQRLTPNVSQLLQLPALSLERTRNSLSLPG